MITELILFSSWRLFWTWSSVVQYRWLLPHRAVDDRGVRTLRRGIQ